jgi:hypothetical protein
MFADLNGDVRALFVALREHVKKEKEKKNRLQCYIGTK